MCFYGELSGTPCKIAEGGGGGGLDMGGPVICQHSIQGNQ